MIVLALDTTTFAGSAAVLKKTKLLAEVNIDSPSTYSERLLPNIDFILKSNGLKMKDIDAFSIAVGPGSFTGIRIGLSTIKSFAYASGKPVASVSTLKALALKLQHPRSRLICPVLDAKKSEIYSALFESTGNSLQEVLAQGVYSPDQFFSLLPSHRVIHFIGNGVGIYRDKIYQYFKDKARFSVRSFFIAYEIGLLGYELLKANKGLDFREIKPLYFRKSQAEENH